ncbi:hypothetical protein PIB30_092198, partial [Stylosanthes scabra]|nr:hypothetical protein [Stylosanthes scabra]
PPTGTPALRFILLQLGQPKTVPPVSLLRSWSNLLRGILLLRRGPTLHEGRDPRQKSLLLLLQVIEVVGTVPYFTLLLSLMKLVLLFINPFMMSFRRKALAKIGITYKALSQVFDKGNTFNSLRGRLLSDAGDPSSSYSVSHCDSHTSHHHTPRLLRSILTALSLRLSPSAVFTSCSEVLKLEAFFFAPSQQSSVVFRRLVVRQSSLVLVEARRSPPVTGNVSVSLPSLGFSLTHSQRSLLISFIRITTTETVKY